MSAGLILQFFTVGEMLNAVLLVAVFVRLGRVIRILKRTESKE